MTEATQATLQVRVYGPLRQHVATDRFTHTTASGQTVREVILELGIPHEHLVYTMALNNDRRVKLDTPVADGDRLDIFQPVAGG